MKRLMFALLLLLILVSAVDATGRHALSQEAPVETAQLATTDVLLARGAGGIVVWKFDGSEWRQLPNGPSWSDAGGWNRPEYYSTIQTGDIDGDGRAELLARGAGGMQAWEYEEGVWRQLPNGPAWSDAGGWNMPEYYSTIQTGDVDGDGREELLGRSATGIEVWAFDGSGWQRLPNGPALSDAAGWDAPEYYSTIQTDNLYGSVGPGSQEELLARSAGGIDVWMFDGSGWVQLADGLLWSDGDGWNAPELYSTIQTGDVDGDGRAEVLARGRTHLEVWEFIGDLWRRLPEGPAWSDANGWNAPEHYSTIQTGDINGYGDAELLARGERIDAYWYIEDNIGERWGQLPFGPAWSDAAGWNAPEYYSTIQTGDVDGDGSAELLARSASGVEVWAFDGSDLIFDESDWEQLPGGPAWSDAAGWNAPEYYSTIQTADIEGLRRIYLPLIRRP